MARTEPDPISKAPLGPHLRALALRGRVQRFRNHTLLANEGDPGDTLFIILAGQVRAFSIGERHREVTYGSYGPGEYLGEMSLDGGTRSASLQTKGATTCAVVSCEVLRSYMAEQPEFAFELLTKVIRRARAATMSTKQLALNDVYGRLKAHLEAQAGPAEDGRRILAPRPTHLQMAQALGCSREMVSRLMKDLERGGWIERAPGALLLQPRLPDRW